MATIFISTPVQSFSNPQVHRLKFTIGLFLVWRPDTVVISMIPTFFNPFAIFFYKIGDNIPMRSKPIGRICHAYVIYRNFKLFYVF
jgi:hypothetical protein